MLLKYYKINHTDKMATTGIQKELYDPVKPFNEQIRELIRSTHPTDGPIVVKPAGKRFKVHNNSRYFSGMSELNATDGIGTKGLLHWRMGKLSNGVQDVFAMVVDDLIEGGYIPVKLQDHILMQEEDKTKIFDAAAALVKLASENRWHAYGRSYPIVITGGETAIIDTLQGFEMGITGTGYAKKGEEIRPRVKEGDLIIGLGSNGIHSNGLSFYREEFFVKRKMRLNDKVPWGSSPDQTTIGEELTKPTYVYLPALKSVIDGVRNAGFKPAAAIHGMVHITGGGLSKLRELSNSKVDIALRKDHSLGPQQIFTYAFGEFGVTSEKMYTRFNNGVGYVIAVDPGFISLVLDTIKPQFAVDVIGEVTKGTGKVYIDSQYEQKTVVY